MKTKHTPAPWKLVKDKSKAPVYRRTIEGIATIGSPMIGLNQMNIEEAEANAEHIVKCVNCHDDMVDALRLAQVALNSNDSYAQEIVREKIKQALSKVGEYEK